MRGRRKYINLVHKEEQNQEHEGERQDGETRQGRLVNLSLLYVMTFYTMGSTTSYFIFFFHSTIKKFHLNTDFELQ